VDGCFWHSCPEHGSTPRNNAEWWAEKLAKNVSRDRDTDAVLANAGWLVHRVWEHEDVTESADRIERSVGERGRSTDTVRLAVVGTTDPSGKI
jgi:DNA mismatch endonuclease (patch repair protein)